MHYAPQIVNFEAYHRPDIKRVSAGGYHTSFLDEIGRAFTCGKNEKGQLGHGTYSEHQTPFFVQRLPEKISEIACGEMHTLLLTNQGEIYAMGDNSKGQIGTGTTS